MDKANAGLDTFEKKAESAHGKVTRISDQTQSSMQRLIDSLEKQAETFDAIIATGRYPTPGTRTRPWSWRDVLEAQHQPSRCNGLY